MYLSYLPRFQRAEDKIEGGAFLICRRFERLGIAKDVLALPLQERDLFPEQERREDEQDSWERKVFRGFTAEDIGLVQLGRLVTLTAGGINEQGQRRYSILRDFFIGIPLVVDYYKALSDNSPYDPTEIMEIARRGNFIYTPQRIADVNVVYAITSPLRDANTQDQPAETKERVAQPKKAEDLRRERSFYEVLGIVNRITKKIDEILLARLK